MRTLSEKHGIDVVIEALRFIRVRLLSRPESKPMAEEVTQRLAGIYSARTQYEEAYDRRRALNAELRYLYLALGTELIQLANLLSSKLGKTSPLYLSVLPSAPSVIMKASTRLSDCRNAVRQILEQAPLAFAKAEAERLVLRIQEIEAAELRRAQAVQDEERQGRSQLNLTIAEARGFYNQLHPRLSLLWPGQKNLVESYFSTLGTSERAAPATP